ncbi:hypothetical protein [Paenibacillus humicola]|uniref:hypothetical protein n=1 Tax=Paenibacillus humicola TaxID=3110540 RepID=UPI00237C23A4|nr:hypothetical protein [Paenibacillus humicola]
MLLNVSETADITDSSTHRTYAFRLERPAGRLGIRFAYAPKHLSDEEESRAQILAAIENGMMPGQKEAAAAAWRSYLPLSNLITLSIDDPAGFRGACHRHDPEQRHFIGEDGASPGLLPGPLREGEWTVTLSFHAVVTDVCAYELQLWTEETP